MDRNTEVVEPHDPYAAVPDSMKPPSSYPKWPFYLAGALVAIGILTLLGIKLLAHLPLLYRFALIVFTPFLLLVFAPGDNKQSAIFTIFALLVVSLIGAAISVWRHEGFYPRGQKVTVAAMTIGMAGLIGGLYAVFSVKEPANPLLSARVADSATWSGLDPSRETPWS